MVRTVRRLTIAILAAATVVAPTGAEAEARNPLSVEQAERAIRRWVDAPAGWRTVIDGCVRVDRNAIRCLWLVESPAPEEWDIVTGEAVARLSRRVLRVSPWRRK